MSSSFILRVSVLRPQPSSTDASRRRPPLRASAASMTIRSKRGIAVSSSGTRRARLDAREFFVRPTSERCLPVARRRAGALDGAQFRRQILDINLSARRHHREPAARVLQLATLPGHGNAGEVLLRFGSQHFRLAAEFRGRGFEEVSGEQRNVFATFRQARQMDADDVEPVIEVFAERTLFDEALEVLVRRRDDAYVDAHRRVSADAIELSVGEYAQQARLRIGRHVADLVEEQRAAVGLFESSDALLCSAGERAFLVAEQFRFDEVLRNGGHVQCDERRARRADCADAARARRVPCRCPIRR